MKFMFREVMYIKLVKIMREYERMRAACGQGENTVCV